MALRGMASGVAIVLAGLAGWIAARSGGGIAEAAPRTRPLSQAIHVERNPCFDAAQLATLVARWLRRDTIDRRLRVDVTGRPGTEDRITLRIVRDGRLAGERSFESLDARCEDVQTALALAAAIAIDATVLETIAPPADATDALEVEPTHAPAPRAFPRFGAAIDAVALFGVLPSPAPAVAPRLGVRLLPSLELRASALVSGEGSATVRDRGYHATLDAGRLDACAALGDALRVRGCGGVAAGAIRASTTSGAAVAQTIPWAAAIGRVDLAASLLRGSASWFGFVLGADLVVPLTRPRFEILGTNGAVAASTGLPVVGVAVSIGPEFVLP